MKRLKTVRWQRRASAVVAGLTALVMVVPAQADQYSATKEIEAAARPEPQRVPSVPGKSFTPASPETQAAPKALPDKSSWPTAGSAEVELPEATMRTSLVKAGGLPVRLGALAGSAPAKVRVEVEKPASDSDELRIRVHRIDGGTASAKVRLLVDYSAFKDAYGGDWASRLVITSPTRNNRVSALSNDSVTQQVSAEIPVDAVGNTYAVAAAPAGSAGDYKATSLAASATWQVSNSGGGFTWAYPFRTPPVPGGLQPDVSASYSSQAVDGRTVATNNQPSWLGEGWDLSPGFIERSYKGCADDLGGNNAQSKTGDLCWETDNATMSFAAGAGPLVYQNGVWRPKDDDGTRVEHLFRSAGINGDDNGEYWRITTPDGTQYYFGLNRLPGWVSGKATTQSTWTAPVYGNDGGEPCHQTTYAASACTQAYRWNLDHVVDPHGNSMSYFYDVETGKYGQNMGATTTTYVRGGVLRKIEYGTKADSYAGAPARVVFTSADRCVPGQNCAAHNATSWPDVPWDIDCTTATCPDKVSPTFWSTKRLTKITTQIWSGGVDYRSVDQWDFGHSYPAPGDATAAGLWLNNITHSGLAGGVVTLPSVRFAGTMKPNRVDSAQDGLPALNKPRITTITSESGGEVNVDYAATNCAPGAKPAADSNTKRCFPVRWTMPPEVEPRDDWFHKYVVAATTEDDLLTDNRDVLTTYTYEGNGAWAYDDNPLVDPKRRTWSQWRGYEKVLVTKGDTAQEPGMPQSATRYQYFRGMYGDKFAAGGTKTPNVTDSAGTAKADLEQYTGFLREQITYDGVKEVSGEIHEPWSRLTATQGTLTAHQVEDIRTQSRTPLAGGGIRKTQVDTAYDEYGNPTKVTDLGDLEIPSDDRCTTTTYAQNASALLMNLPSQVKTVGVACGTAPSYPADAIADSRTSYDGGAFGAIPQRGDATRTEVAKSYTGSTPTYLTTSTSTYDAFGRSLEIKDALQRKSTSAYVETNGLTTSTSSTNALGHTSTDTLDPAFGQPVTKADANQRITSLKYDPLGRLAKVWLPGRTEANNETPHLQYEYGVRQSGGPNWVKTLTLKANGNQVTSYNLLDGFLRQRQTQTPSPLGGRVLTDELYNSRGLVYTKRSTYYNNNGTGPGTTLFQPNAGAVPNASVITYDGAERPTTDIYFKDNVEQWRTSTTYGGDRVTVLPPAGGTLTTTVTDVRGQATSKLQYQGRTTSTPVDTTSYGYTNRGDLASIKDSMKDPAGNPAGNVWRYEYDVLGRQVKADDPDKGVTTMTYDDAGQLVATTDARNKTLVSTYDDLGRKVESRLGSTSGTLMTKSVYDTLSKGALTSSTRYVGVNGYERAVTGYDEVGRPKGEKVTIPASEGKLAGSYTSSVSYADDGSPWSIGMPALGDLPAESINYSYDEFGLSDKVTGLLPYVTDTEYTALGEVTQLELGTEAKKLWKTSFYEAGTRRLSQVKTEREAVGGVLVANQTYAYDPVGNVTRTTDQVQGSAADTQCFSYDYLRRTKAAWTGTDQCAGAPAASTIGGPAPYWQEFTYDLIGNRTKQINKGLAGATDKVSTYTYPTSGDGVDRPHAVTSVAVGSSIQTFSYDPTGNTLAHLGPDGSQQNLIWDDEGLLASIGVTGYIYDADGKQLIRRDEGSATLFLGNGEVKVTMSTGVAQGTRYYDGIGARTRAGFTWTVADRNGTAQVGIAETTQAAVLRRFDLFGQPRGATPSWTGGDRAFVGGTPNSGTGLTRLGAREYDPSLGRFLSVDPIIDPVDPQQLNAYAYGNNSPSTFSDPDGLIYYEGDSGRSYGNQAAVNNAAKAKRGKSLKRPLTNPPGGRLCKYVACKKAMERKRVRDHQQRQKFRPRGPHNINKGRPTPMSDMFSLFEADGRFNSASLCLEGLAGVGWAVGMEACINGDEKGFSFSRGGKAGLLLGAEVSAGVNAKLNTENAESVGNGRGTEVSGVLLQDLPPAEQAARGGIFGRGRFGFGISPGWTYDPTSGQGSAGISAGIGAGLSVGGVFETYGENSGYIATWEEVDGLIDVVGDLGHLW
jgi:RHS repeat-associated protein